MALIERSPKYFPSCDTQDQKLFGFIFSYLQRERGKETGKDALKDKSLQCKLKQV